MVEDVTDAQKALDDEIAVFRENLINNITKILHPLGTQVDASSLYHFIRMEEHGAPTSEVHVDPEVWVVFMIALCSTMPELSREGMQHERSFLLVPLALAVLEQIGQGRWRRCEGPDGIIPSGPSRFNGH